MDSIAGIPFFPLEITKDGRVFNPAQKTVIENAVRDTGAAKLTDLFVISHGWNNDMAEARALYERLFANVIALRPRHNELADRKFGIVGIFWPSKKFADSELIPAGGAASLDGDGGLDSSVLKQRLESLKDFFDKPDKAPLERAKALIDGIEDSVSKQQEFVKIIHALMPGAPRDHVDDAAVQFVLTPSPSHEVLEILGRPWMSTAAAGAGGGALDLNDPVGGAASFGDFFSGIKAGALRLLNYATYYQMKERAGVVGKALNGVLGPVRRMRPDLRLHLIGHSFGARVVSSAVDGQAAIRPSSLTLLQGAFSHNGFTEKFDGTTDGFFRKVIGESKVTGPILATHTVNDKAVGIAYAIASRLSGDNTKGIGDENDPFGGIGRNGAVRMHPAEFVRETLRAEDHPYRFQAHKVHNLEADAFISDHGDVEGPQVANAILCAVKSTP
jgi:hypothetical protein